MRTLHGHDGKQIDSVAALRDLHCRSQTGEAAADNRYLQTITCH
jgi:hypothetical protein